jgi:hypothetical protein
MGKILRLKSSRLNSFTSAYKLIIVNEITDISIISVNRLIGHENGYSAFEGQ